MFDVSVRRGWSGKDETDDVVGMGVQQGVDVPVRNQVVRWGGHLGGIINGETDTSERA
jgi:hypothetical protein